MAASPKTTWPWWKVLLWAYTLILNALWLLILLVGAFDQSSHVSNPNMYMGLFLVALYLPCIIFGIIIGKDNLG